MPKRLLIGSIVTSLVVLFVLQVTRLRVLAEDFPITGPLTPPITSEISDTPTPTMTNTPTPTMTNTPTPTATDTPTMTPTVTPSPTGEPTDEEVTLSGKIIYKELGVHASKTNRVKPADGVEVKVEGFFDEEKKYTDTTDAAGNYAIDLPPGLWKVKVADEEDSFFVPPVKMVRVNEEAKTANFQGLVFP